MVMARSEDTPTVVLAGRAFGSMQNETHETMMVK